MKGPSAIVKESWNLGDIEFERTESFRVPVAAALASEPLAGVETASDGLVAAL